MGDFKFIKRKQDIVIAVLPYFPGDQKLAATLSEWISDLGSNTGHTVLLVRDTRCNRNYDETIKHNLAKVFDSVEVIDVPERLDGWPKSPNVMFRKAAKHIQCTSTQPFLWLEPDVVPLKSGWVEAIAKEYAACGKPFLGDFVQVENVTPHMSGIGAYANQVIDYAPDLIFADDIAFDVFAADKIVPQMAQTHLISHKWKFPKLNNQSEVDNLLAQLGDAVLFHQDKSGSLIEFLRERRNPSVSPQIANQNTVAVTTGAGIGSVDIFIKTYPKDYSWLVYCLKSIHKFCTGIRSIVLITSGGAERNWESEIFPIQMKHVPEHGNDNYLSQQVFKMYSDTYTDADYILHIDSDTIFTRQVTPETYFRNGKPVIMITPIEQAHPDQDQTWRRVMQKFMGRPSEYEYMRRFPIVYPRWAYGALREFCVKQHGVELDKYIMSQPYREFSEFNVMGFFLYEYHRDKFEWIDTSKVPESQWPELTVDQRWSHNPIPVEEWEKILGSTPEVVPVSSVEKQPRAEEKTLPELLDEVAKHFKSPLAKGRIFKRLKSYPITK